MHYESFLTALTNRFGNQDPLPNSPLVVDLGCGPATTLFALGDWMYERRGGPSLLASIGIDISAPLLRIGNQMITGANLFAPPSVHLMRHSVEDLTDADLAEAVKNRDGVICALSYVVHQEFMLDMRLLASLMMRVRRYSRGLPTWFLLQDANFPERPDEFTEIWPESRINVLANRCEEVGYRIRNWKTKFTAPRLVVGMDGQFRAGQAGETQNVCHFFQRIA